MSRTTRRPWAEPSSAAHKRVRGRKGQEIRRRILDEEPICRVCKRRPSVEVDHIRPLAKGGSDDRSNKQGICIPCHEAKTIREQGGKPRVRIAADGWPVE